jgi:Putative beta-barrel porin 2
MLIPRSCTLPSIALALGAVIVGPSLFGQADSAAGSDPSPSPSPSPPPVLTVNRAEAAVSEQERPVLSVNQDEVSAFEGEQPVLPVEPSVSLPEQSPLERQGTTQERTVLDEGPAFESRPSGGKEVEPVRKWGLQFRGRVGVAYDDNIFISNTDPVADVILGVTGGVSLIYGDWRSKFDNFLVADYEGGGFFYLDNPDQDSFNQIASLSGQVRFQRLAVLLRSQYAYLTGAQRDVGGLATRNLIDNTLRFTYDLSTKTSLWAEGFANLAVYQSFFNSYDFGAKAGADYQILQKVRLGPEFVVGFLNVVDSPNQTYQQLRARVSYQATGKLTFEGSAGVEFLQFDSQNKTLFVFSAGGTYRPLDGTAIALRGYRNVYGSAALEGQNFIATGVELSVTQRFLHRFYVTVNTGYENDDYFAVAEDTDSDRVDNYVFVRPALAFAFTRWASISLFYEYRQNFSTDPDFPFSNNRCGGSLAFQF